MNLSNHSVKRYSERAGYTNYLEARNNLENNVNNGMILTYEEVTALGFNVKYNKGDMYVVWYDEHIRQKMCAIRSYDLHIKTVLPEKFYIPKRRRFAYA